MLFRLKNGVGFIEIKKEDYLNDNLYYRKIMQVLFNKEFNETYNSNKIPELIHNNKSNKGKQTTR